MLADLLHEQALDKKSDLLAPSYAPYRQGLAQKLVEGPKLKASAGHRFSALVQPCEEWEETLMLAVHSKAGGVLLNPGPTYPVAAADAAIIVCARDKVTAAVKDIEKGITLPINSKDESGLGTAGSTGYGFHSLAAPVALRDARISGVDEVCPDGGHVLLGGNLESCGILPQLVKNLRRDYFPCRKIVLMEPTEPSEDVWQSIAAFPDVYVLLGNTTEAADLRRAGADRAHSVILLSPWNEEQKKSKKSRKGDAGVAPYTSIMKVQQVLKDELRSTVRTLLCVGKNHKGTAKELTPAQREHQTINHPLHASSLMMTYDLFDYWLAKAFASKKGVLGEVAEQLVRGVVQSVPAARLQALVAAAAAAQSAQQSPTTAGPGPDAPAKPLTFGELVRWAGTKGFLPLGYYRWTGSEEGSFVHTHPARECEVADGDRIILLWPRGETPASLPLPSPAEADDDDAADRARADTSFDMDYISLPKLNGGDTVAHAPPYTPTLTPTPTPTSSSTLARPPPPLALPPSLAPPPAPQRPPAVTVADDAPPPSLPPRGDDDDDGRSEDRRLPPPPPVATSPRSAPSAAAVEVVSLAGFSPRSPPAATSPRVAVPPRPVPSSSASPAAVTPRAPPPAVSPRSPPSTPPAESPRLPPAVSPRSPPPPVSPRSPPPSTPPAVSPRLTDQPQPPAVASPRAPPAVSPRSPPPAAPPATAPAPAVPRTQPGLQRPPALQLPPSLAPPPALRPPPALGAPTTTTTTTTSCTTHTSDGDGSADERRAIPAFATVRRPTTSRNRRPLTSLHRTISSSTLSRLQQQQQQDEAAATVALQTLPSPRASAPPAFVSLPPSPSPSSSSRPPVFTPPPRFTPAPALPATTTKPLTRSTPGSPALAPPPVLALPPTLVPPPALSLPPSSSSSSSSPSTSTSTAAAMAFSPTASWMTLGTNPYPSLRGPITAPGAAALPPPSPALPPPSLALPPPSLHTPQ